MNKAVVLGLMALALATPAEARRCLNGTVMAPNGACVSPDELAAMQRPQAKSQPQGDYKSCPMDFKLEGGRCVPRSICTYDSKTCRR